MIAKGIVTRRIRCWWWRLRWNLGLQFIKCGSCGKKSRIPRRASMFACKCGAGWYTHVVFKDRIAGRVMYPSPGDTIFKDDIK